MKLTELLSFYKVVEPLTIVRAPLLPRRFACSDTDAPELFARYPFILAAIRLASPDLAAAHRKRMLGPDAMDKRARLRLNMYVRRMSTRTTPFGMFSAIGSVAWTDGKTDLELASLDRCATRTRPDMSWLSDLVQSIEGNAAIRHRLSAHTNDMSIGRGDRLFIHNPRNIGEKAGQPLHNPTSLRNTPAVDWIRSKASAGISYADLHRETCERFAPGEVERVRKFLDGLWDSGVLVSDLFPPASESPLQYLKERLAAIDPGRHTGLALLEEKIRLHDARPPNQQTCEHVAELESEFRDIAPGQRVLQIDTVRPTTGAISRSVLREIERCAPLLLCFRRNADPLEALRSEFLRRYEGSEAMIPLLELTDPEFGIAIPSVRIAEGDSKNPSPALIDVYACAQRTRTNHVTLTDEQLSSLMFCPRPDEIPESFEFAFHLIAQDSASLDDGDYLITPSKLVGSSAAGRSLGRFADVLGDDVIAAMRGSANREDEDELAAELIFMPSTGRAGNVAHRPQMCDVEVQLGLYSSRQGVCRISPTDIYIGLDGSRFFAWSKSRRKRLKLHESHLMNVSGFATPAARLLSALQQQSRKPAPFSWAALSGAPSLPRLQYGRMIISPARYKLSRKDLLSEGRLQEWRSTWNVPRFVVAGSDDRTILVDLDSTSATDLLSASTPSTVESIQIEECPYIMDSNWLKSSGEEHVGEFVVSLKLRESCGDDNRKRVVPQLFDRTVSPDWLSIKLYCGKERMDALLRAHVPELLQKQQSAGVLRKYFFVRYGDPKSHLRLRILARDGARAAVREDILSFSELLCEAGFIDDFSLSPYFPELDRYGGPEMLATIESLFHLDSEVALQRLEAHFGVPFDRLKAAFETVCPLFDAFLSNDSAMQVWADMTSGMSRLKFDAEERVLARRVSAPRNSASELTEKFCGIVRLMRQACEPSRVEDAPLRLLPSIIHMHCNRFGLTQSQEQRILALLRQRTVSLLAQR